MRRWRVFIKRGPSHLAHSAALCNYTRRAWFLDDPPDIELVQQGLYLFGDLELRGFDVQREKAYTLARLGRLLIDTDKEKAEELLTESLPRCQELNDHWSEANVLEYQAELMFQLGKFEKARQLYSRSLRIRSRLNDRTGRAKSLRGLARIARFQGHFEGAMELAQESVTIQQEDPNSYGLPMSLNGLAFALQSDGRFGEAGEVFQERLEILQELGVGQASYGLWGDGNEVLQGCYEAVRKYYPVEEEHIES